MGDATYAQARETDTETETDMPASAPAGPAARMLIARGLVRLRERAGLTQGQLADAAGCGKATVGRYEEWQDRARVKWATVRALADACGATPDERDALVQLARSQGAGWWVGNQAVPEWMDPILSFEEAGEYEHVYASSLVPGLLQTRTYALAIHRAQLVRAPAAEIEQQVELRMQRQRVLEREAPPLHLWAILDEAVLRREVGGASVMAEQIDHLLAASERPNVTIQVLPFASGAHAVGAGQPFMIIGRDDERRPLSAMSVTYLEMHNRGLYLDDASDVAQYKTIFDYLRAQAADPARTAELLRTTRREYRP
ncbi:transcriptional regulator [Streptomyces albus]|nr:transcriptional regulator [Streptomyces albus]